MQLLWFRFKNFVGKFLCFKSFSPLGGSSELFSFSVIELKQKSSIFLELLFNKLIIVAFFCFKFFMVSLFDEFAFLHYQNSVCIDNRWKTMGNDNYRNLIFRNLSQTFNWILNHLLTVRIQGRCCLIKNNNFRLPDQCPRNWNPLLLSST